MYEDMMVGVVMWFEYLLRGEKIEMSNKLLEDYEIRLSLLRNWPDRSIIADLTSFALRNEHIANHIADILIAKIIDVSRLYMKPIFNEKDIARD